MPDCLLCNRKSPNYTGLHKHLSAAHKIRALAYYLKFPGAMLERLDSQSEKVQVREDLTPCWEWTGLRDSKGYARMRVAGAATAFGHRNALLARGEVVAPELYVLHGCDNPPCVNPEHLRGDTPVENARERSDRGRSCCGAAHHNAKLDDDRAFMVRAEKWAGFSHSQIADRFGVSKSAIDHIVAGRNFAHVGEPHPDVFLF